MKLQPAPGTWEENRNSRAYVGPLKRHKYVHGAVWLGKKESVLQMCELLSSQVEDDLQKNLIAIWHDESHLNHFSANSKVGYLPRHFSSFSGSTLSDISQSYVESIWKPDLDAIVFSRFKSDSPKNIDECIQIIAARDSY